MANVLKIKTSDQVPRPGEKARLRVVQGPDYGSSYVLTGIKAVIGRGEQTDVFISDLKASRKHAEVLLAVGGWAVRDLGSANGILHNGVNVRNHQLAHGDTITLGETTLEFVSSDAGALMIMATPKSIEKVRKEEAAFVAQRNKVAQLAKLPGAAPMLMGGLNPNLRASGKKKANPLLVIAAVGVLAFMFMGDPKPKPSAKSAEPARVITSIMPSADPLVSNKTADGFFKAGFREYRSKNYLRALTQFENVLQIDPNHTLARLYQSNCLKSIKEEVQFHLDHGRKSETAGKLRDAKGHFEAVLRLLHQDQSSPDYIEARDQLKTVLDEMRGGKSG